MTPDSETFMLLTPCLLAGIALVAAAPEEVRYVRLLAGKAEAECTFTQARGDDGWTNTNVTGRGAKTPDRADPLGHPRMGGAD